MPISLTKGTLVRRYEDDASGTINAVVQYEFSNGATEEKNHTGIPMYAVQAIATAAGRAEYSRSDVCAFIAQQLGADLAPATIEVAPIPEPPPAAPAAP
jgi:hypothetical protein